MHIVVCVKSVITVAPKGKPVRSADTCALNPFDRPALEAALQVKALQGGSVTVLSMGPPSAGAALREALAMGVDRAVLLCDPALAGSDTLATATALGAGLRRLTPFDLVLFGTRTADSDTGQVGSQSAELLGIPMVTGVFDIGWSGNRFTVNRRVDGFVETYGVAPPTALAIAPTAFPPRDAPLGAIGVAFDEMTVETVALEALGLDPQQVGEAGSPTRVLSIHPVKRDRTCQWIDGTPAEQSDRLASRLTAAGLMG